MTVPAQLAAAAEVLAAGGLIIVVDEAYAEGAGRGFFLHAAARATEAGVATAILHGRGISCFSVTPEQAMRLGLTLAGAYRQDHRGPLFLRSVEAAACDGTGISAFDRAQTLRAAGRPDAGIGSLKSPGHVLPAMTNGGSPRAVANAAVAVLRGLCNHEVPAWMDILDDEGELAGTAWCLALAEKLDLPCVTLAAFEVAQALATA